MVTHAGSSRTAANWLVFSRPFVADAASTSVTFTDTSHNQNAGIYLDALSVTPLAAAAVPEPATWAMMVLGFGAIGLGRRRRGTVAPGVRAA